VQEQPGLEHDPSQTQNFISDKSKFQELAGTPTSSHYARDEKMAVGGEEQEMVVGEPRRYCGLSKKMMYGLLALVFIVVIAAVVGGAVGSQVSKKNSTSTSASPTSTSSGSGTSTAALVTATATSTSTHLGAIAASNFEDDGSYLSVYYQKGADIMYTVHTTTSSYASPQNLTLNTIPKTGTPLAAVSYSGDSGAEVSACRSVLPQYTNE
jgi:hypothetical protein